MFFFVYRQSILDIKAVLFSIEEDYYFTFKSGKNMFLYANTLLTYDVSLIIQYKQLYRVKFPKV